MLDPAFNPGGTDTSGTVYGMAVQPDRKTVIGGTFTMMGGQPRARIARLDEFGGVESPAAFNVGVGVDSQFGTVLCVAVQADGKILIGGRFSSVNTQTRHAIARLEANGTLEATATFHPATVANDQVICMAVQPDGKTLLGGNFLRPDMTRARLIRLLPDGTEESTATFNPGTGPNESFYGDSVNTVLVQADGRILIGGYFSRVNGEARNGIARLLSNGSVEPLSAFDPGSGAIAGSGNTGTGVHSVALQADGGILLGGAFTSVNGQPRSGLARLRNEAALETLAAPNPSRVKWDRMGTAPEIGQVTFDLSPDGANWTPLGPGTRSATGWTLEGLSLPASGMIRARGRAHSGSGNGSSGIMESISAIMTRVTMWRAQTFGPNAGDLTSSGNLADPDRGGFANAFEYAGGSDALDPTSVPRLAWRMESGGLVFQYTRRVGAADIIYGIEKSTDLVTWVDAPITEQVLSNDGIVMETEATATFDQNELVQPTGFLRGKVTIAP